MNPDRLARSLTLFGTAGLVYFYFLSHNPFGTVLALGVVMGSGTVQYTDRKPYVIPYVLVLLAIIAIMQIVKGQLVALVVGTALGMGLPYIVFRQR